MGTVLGLGVVPVTSLAPGVGPTFFLFFSLKPLYHHHHNHHCPNRTAPPSSIWSHACWGCARRRKPKLEIKLSRLEETKAKGGTFCVRDKTCPLEKTIMCVCVFQPPCRHMCAGIVLRLQPVTSSVFWGAQLSIYSYSTLFGWTWWQLFTLCYQAMQRFHMD